MVQTTIHLLTTWGFNEAIIANFVDQEVEADQFDSLTEEDLKILIPNIGPRRKFQVNLKKRLADFAQKSIKIELINQQPEATQQEDLDYLPKRQKLKQAETFIGQLQHNEDIITVNVPSTSASTEYNEELDLNFPKREKQAETFIEQLQHDEDITIINSNLPSTSANTEYNNLDLNFLKREELKQAEKSIEQLQHNDDITIINSSLPSTSANTEYNNLDLNFPKREELKQAEKSIEQLQHNEDITIINSNLPSTSANTEYNNLDLNLPKKEELKQAEKSIEQLQHNEDISIINSSSPSTSANTEYNNLDLNLPKKEELKQAEKSIEQLQHNEDISIINSSSPSTSANTEYNNLDLNLPKREELKQAEKSIEQLQHNEDISIINSSSPSTSANTEYNNLDLNFPKREELKQAEKSIEQLQHNEDISIINSSSPSTSANTEYNKDLNVNLSKKEKLEQAKVFVEQLQHNEDIIISNPNSPSTSPNTEYNNKATTDIRQPTADNEYDLKSILKKSVNGQLLLKLGKKRKQLNDDLRNKLAKIIIKNELSSDINNTISRERASFLSDQITKLFPTENKNIWYIKNKKDKLPGRGKILTKYYCIRRKYIKAGLLNETDADFVHVWPDDMKLIFKALIANRKTLLQINTDIEDLRNDIRQLRNSNNIVTFNPIKKLETEMPTKSMDEMSMESRDKMPIILMDKMPMELIDKMPMKSMDEFLKFDKTLNNKKISKDFIRFVRSSLDRSTNNPVKSVHTILKRMFKKNLALQFTVLKQSGEKQIFKSTNAYKKIKDIVIGTHMNVEDNPKITKKVFHSALGVGFANARNWMED
ncbi:MATH and LRR domain-containing protein PFE0570w isoform X6 [Solenopsis invicta]|uniref:MATH and LRR domain-containing protein PFE0570w isoform X6 n=1 Tax=Solenopsis invicta TaxID=13686 RepID=UPI00193DD4D9|nr:MATH and LRR domain-containing protein PFE0570w isoform X6 [Solenopsis invicta]